MRVIRRGSVAAATASAAAAAAAVAAAAVRARCVVATPTSATEAAAATEFNGLCRCTFRQQKRRKVAWPKMRQFCRVSSDWTPSNLDSSVISFQVYLMDVVQSSFTRESRRHWLRHLRERGREGKEGRKARVKYVMASLSLSLSRRHSVCYLLLIAMTHARARR